MSGSWVKFFPSDWLAGTRGLTAAETGVYITLISMMYEREAPIPMETKRLSRLLGMSVPAFEKVISGLMDQGKVTVQNGGYWNGRVEIEIKNRQKTSLAASESAKQRWDKAHKKQGSDDADAVRTECELDAIPDTRYQIEGDKSPSRARAVETVDQIWQRLPKRKRAATSKAKLLKPVSKLLKAGNDPAVIVAAVSRCYSEPRHQDEDGQYAPAIYSWLSDGVWENYAAPERVEQGEITAEQWSSVFRLYCEAGTWAPHAGPAPGQDGCRAPADLLAKYFEWVEVRKLKGAAA